MVPQLLAREPDGSFPHLLRHLAMVTAKFVYFFLWPELCVPLLALPWLLRDRRVRLVVFEAVLLLSCASPSGVV